MLSTIGVVVALVSAFSVATVVFLDQRGTQGLTSELSQRTGSHLTLRASFDRATEAEQQDAAVRAAIDRTFADTGVSFTVIRALEAEAYVAFVADDGTERTSPSTASTFADVADHAIFATGAAPRGDREVAIPVDAAALWGANTGDELLINDLPFTISGTWRAADPRDPRWYADPRVENGGVDSDRLGPFVDEPERVRDEILTVLPADTRIDTSTDPVGREVLGAAPIAIWAAALCCVLIAGARSRGRRGGVDPRSAHGGACRPHPRDPRWAVGAAAWAPRGRGPAGLASVVTIPSPSARMVARP